MPSEPLVILSAGDLSAARLDLTKDPVLIFPRSFRGVSELPTQSSLVPTHKRAFFRVAPDVFVIFVVIFT